MANTCCFPQIEIRTIIVVKAIIIFQFENENGRVVVTNMKCGFTTEQE